jgi:hypothetical protein
MRARPIAARAISVIRRLPAEIGAPAVIGGVTLMMNNPPVGNPDAIRVAATPKEYVPIAVGLPEIVPVDQSITKPGGKLPAVNE